MGHLSRVMMRQLHHRHAPASRLSPLKNMKQLRKVVIKKKQYPNRRRRYSAWAAASLGESPDRPGRPQAITVRQSPCTPRRTRSRWDEKYDAGLATSQNCPAYTDLFGFFSKNDNALDFLIEVAKNHLQTWGSKPPTFMLCNRNLTKGLTMNPEKTKYVTIGPMANRSWQPAPSCRHTAA